MLCAAGGWSVDCWPTSGLFRARPNAPKRQLADVGMLLLSL